MAQNFEIHIDFIGDSVFLGLGLFGKKRDKTEWDG